MEFSLIEIAGYVLIFLRIGGIYFALPVIGDTPTPVRVRLLLSLGTSLCIVPILPETFAEHLQLSPVFLGIAVLKELLIGLVLGYCARIAFDGLIMAASVVGYQMGFGTANLLVPDANMQMDGFTAFHRILMILIFFSLDMHHSYIYTIGETFRIVPLGVANFSLDFADFFIKLTAGIFATAMQLAAPVLVALLFTMAALGLIARTVPQMNVFTMSFPVSFFLGLIVYMSTFAFMPDWLSRHFNSSNENMVQAILGFR